MVQHQNIPGETFLCKTMKDCHHDGEYVCTTRPEVETCQFAEIGRYPANSRGACKRFCHFDATCGSYAWNKILETCVFCGSTDDKKTWTWTFSSYDFASEGIVEWHHGWFHSGMMSVWTGKIDLVLSGYINPSPMRYETSHILLPGAFSDITYTFQGHNCLVLPWKQPLKPNPKETWSESIQYGMYPWMRMLGLCLIILYKIVIPRRQLRKFLRDFW